MAVGGFNVRWGVERGEARVETAVLPFQDEQGVCVCMCVVGAFSHWPQPQSPIHVNRQSRQELGTYRNTFLYQSVTRSLEERTGGMETSGLRSGRVIWHCCWLRRERILVTNKAIFYKKKRKIFIIRILCTH